MIASLNASPLCRHEGWNLRLRLKELHHWAQPRAIVCLLEPVDTDLDKFRELIDRRKELDGKMERDFGITSKNFAYAPHITIAYYDDPNLAENVEQKVAAWNSVFAGEINGKFIKFDTVSLYAFTDMITYFTSKSLFRGNLIN